MKFNNEIYKSVNRKNNFDFAAMKIGTKLTTAMKEWNFT